MCWESVTFTLDMNLPIYPTTDLITLIVQPGTFPILLGAEHKVSQDLVSRVYD